MCLLTLGCMHRREHAMSSCPRAPRMLKYTSGNIVPGRNALKLAKTRASLLDPAALPPLLPLLHFPLLSSHLIAAPVPCLCQEQGCLPSHAIMPPPETWASCWDWVRIWREKGASQVRQKLWGWGRTRDHQGGQEGKNSTPNLCTFLDGVRAPLSSFHA